MIKKIGLFLLFLVGILILVQVMVASKYRAVFRVVEEGQPVGMNPTTERLDFGDLPKGTTAIRSIALENSGRYKIWVKVLKFGGISEILTVSQASFILEPSQEQKLSFQVKLPVSADKPEYKGWIWIFKIPIF